MEPGTAGSSEQVAGPGEGGEMAPVLAKTPADADVAPPQKLPPVRKRRAKPELDLDARHVLEAGSELIAAEGRTVGQGDGRGAGPLEAPNHALCVTVGTASRGC